MPSPAWPRRSPPSWAGRRRARSTRPPRCSASASTPAASAGSTRPAPWATRSWTSSATGTPSPIAVTTAGSDGDAVTDTEVLGDPNLSTGMYALDRVDLFNLLVIPPVAPGADVAANTWQTALSYCQSRRAFLIVDPPTAW